MHSCSLPQAGNPPYPFDASRIAKRFRHAAIFGSLAALHPGETMRFHNDHDPIPLLHQIAAHFGDAVQVTYRSRDEDGVVIDFTIVA